LKVVELIEKFGTFVYFMFQVYIAEDVCDEPDLQFFPDNGTPVSSLLPPGDNLLARSLQQLDEGLTSGSIMTQFEVTTCN